MLLHGDAAAGRVPDIEPPLHEAVVRQSFAERPALHRQAMAEAVHDEHGLRVNERRDLGRDGFRVTVAADRDALAVGYFKRRGGLGVDPQHVFRHLLSQHGIVGGMSLGVHRAAAEGQAELAFRRMLRRIVRHKGGQTLVFELFGDDLELAAGGWDL